MNAKIANAVRFYRLWRLLADKLAHECANTMFVVALMGERNRSRRGRYVGLGRLRRRAELLALRSARAHDRMQEAQARAQREREDENVRLAFEGQAGDDDGNP